MSDQDPSIPPECVRVVHESRNKGLGLFLYWRLRQGGTRRLPCAGGATSRINSHVPDPCSVPPGTSQPYFCVSWPSLLPLLLLCLCQELAPTTWHGPPRPRPTTTTRSFSSAPARVSVIARLASASAFPGSKGRGANVASAQRTAMTMAHACPSSSMPTTIRTMPKEILLCSLACPQATPPSPP